MYDHYISLGFNCEVAFQIRRILGKDSSSFFSWNVTKFSSLLSLLNKGFTGILQPENIKQHGDGSLFFDQSHEICFHSPFSTPDPHRDIQFDLKLNDLREKTNYLVSKFYELAKSDEKIAYFYKLEETITDQQISNLCKLIDDIHENKKNYKVVIIKLKNNNNLSYSNEYLEIHNIARFSPYNDATDGHVSSYDKIFRKLKYNGVMHFSGY